MAKNHVKCTSKCRLQSNAQNTKSKESKIIIAASGMLSGGCVLEYLKYHVGDHRNAVLIIGFQAEGTRGRALLNQGHELKIHGKYYPLRANAAEITGLSAHADQTELLHWLKETGLRAKQVFLVHGEASAQETLRVKIQTELGFPVKISHRVRINCYFSARRPLLPQLKCDQGQPWQRHQISYLMSITCLDNAAHEMPGR